MEHHYVYQIMFEEVPHIYFRSRTCRCLPEEDTKYMGSPVTYKCYWIDNTPVKTILVKEFGTRADAIAYENNLIQKQWDEDISLSLNDSISGVKFSTLGRPHSDDHRKKLSNATKGRILSKEHRDKLEKVNKQRAVSYFFISPEGIEYSGIGLVKFCEDKELNVPNLYDRLFSGKALHIKGWTTSWEDHKLYLYHYKYRGISVSKTNWISVRWMETGKRKSKNFKTLEEAIIFRDNIERKLNFKFQVNAKRNSHSLILC